MAEGRTILVVDDEPDLLNAVRLYLEDEGYQVLTATNGEEALEKVRTRLPDLVVLDVMMPEMNGFEALQEIRRVSHVPVIMLTVKGEEGDKVRGLSLGADDYVTKPFSQRELLSRIQAVLRRAETPAFQPRTKIVVDHDLTIDFSRNEVWLKGKKVQLTPTEYRLLEFLMQRPGRVFSREQLLDGVWGSEVYIDERTVDVHAGRLRKALNRGHATDPIRTVRGTGYALDDRFGKTA